MALNPWYSHCGSTNHGMMIKWYTDTNTANLRIEMTQYLQADLNTWTLDSSGKYYLNTATYTTTDDGYYFLTDVLKGTNTDEYANDYPKVHFLVILVNENSDCTSSMVCKDGFQVLIDLKAKLSGCSSACAVTEADFEANWKETTTAGETVFIDQTVSSGYTTIDATVESVVKLETATHNLC